MALTKPSPANSEANESIVTGFVSVRKKVEPYAPKRPVLFSVDGFSDGLANSVLTPKKQRKTPPKRRSQSCCLTSRSDMKVKPKPAIAPYMASAVAAPKPETSP